jgi:hypothetical protein
MYRDHADRIRIGLLMGLLAICFILPWAGALSWQLNRIEGRATPLSYAQLGAAVLAPVAFILPMMCWLIASYRPDTRSVEITTTLHEAGWLLFVMVVFSGPPWLLSIAVAILQDRRERPLFPRWSACFTIWAELLFVPGCLAVFFKSGPLAWNGLFVFWMPFGAFTLWLLVMSKLMLDVINRSEPVAGTPAA